MVTISGALSREDRRDLREIGYVRPTFVDPAVSLVVPQDGGVAGGDGFVAAVPEGPELNLYDAQGVLSGMVRERGYGIEDKGFAPYEPPESTTPASPLPRSAGKKCGGLGRILLTAVAVGVTAAVTGPAAGLLGSKVAGGIAAGIAGSVASQSVGVATGLQPRFDWNRVALAGISSAVGGVVGGIDIGAGSFVDGAVRVALGNAVTQGIAVATDLQDRFDWTGVASAGLGGGVAATLGDALGVESFAENASAGNIAAASLANTAGAVANAAVRSVVDGTSFADNVLAALPDAVGQTIGNFVGGRIIHNQDIDARAERLIEMVAGEGADWRMQEDVRRMLREGQSEVAIARHYGADVPPDQYAQISTGETGFDPAVAPNIFNDVASAGPFSADITVIGNIGTLRAIRYLNSFNEFANVMAEASAQGLGDRQTNELIRIRAIEHMSTYRIIDNYSLIYNSLPYVGAGKNAIEIYYGNDLFTGKEIDPKTAIITTAISVVPGLSVVRKVGGAGVTKVVASGVWKLPPVLRGEAIEQALGHNLPKNFPVIDRFENGVATSIKSIDLDADTYLKGERLKYTLTKYVGALHSFKGSSLQKSEILDEMIAYRQLDVAVPHLGNDEQRDAIRAAINYANYLGINLRIIVFP